jgi:hypothetical protein
MGTNKDGIEVTLTSDEVFALALIAFAAFSANRLAADSALVVELLKSAIVLKNIEVHMALAHQPASTAAFGGGFGESH